MIAQRITVDPTLCSGFGACIDVAPELFRLGEDGHAEVIGDAAAYPEAAAAAADACPMAAILLERGGS